MAATAASAGNKAGVCDISPLVRKAFFNGLKEIQRRTGKTFSVIMADAIEEEGIIPVMKTVAQFAVKEAKVSGAIQHNHDHNGQINVDQTKALIDQVLQKYEKVINEQPEESDLALPHVEEVTTVKPIITTNNQEVAADTSSK